MTDPASDCPKMDLLSVDRLVDRLNSEERRLRSVLMNRIIDQGEPLCERGLERLTELIDCDIENSYRGLLAKQLLVNDDGKILFVYPVSARPTSHRVRLADGRRFHAMCAIDAMGAAFTFQQDVTITSRCGLCDGPVTVNLRNGEVDSLQPLAAHVLHVDLNKFSDWSGNC